MSELKEHLFCECDEFFREYRGQLSNENRPYYLKSEADKVIAEKDAEIARLNDKALQYKVLDEEHCRDLNTQERRFALQIAHHKYKRCLAMAKWCDAESDVADADGDYYDMKWYQKWHNRWLELADKFKDKEAK